MKVVFFLHAWRKLVWLVRVGWRMTPRRTNLLSGVLSAAETTHSTRAQSLWLRCVRAVYGVWCVCGLAHEVSVCVYVLWGCAGGLAPEPGQAHRQRAQGIRGICG